MNKNLFKGVYEQKGKRLLWILLGLVTFLITLASPSMGLDPHSSFSHSTPTLESDRISSEKLFLAQGFAPDYLQKLAEADRFYGSGDLQAASRIQSSIKPVFEGGGTAVSEPITDVNSDRLSGAARVYWRNAQEGIQQNLESKIFQPLNLLTENYPDFLPGHLALAENCERDPIACDRNAKGNQPHTAIEVIDRATSLYPDRKELLDAHIAILVRSAEATEKPYPYLEASILSRQYAITYPNRPESARYAEQADDLLQIYQVKLEEIVVSNVLIQSILSRDQSVFGLLLYGESLLGEIGRDQIIERVGLLENQATQDYVNRVGQKLAQWAGRSDFTYEFYVTPEEEPNASALPGGKIFITQGQLALMESEAELAGILSHEISHTTLSHGYVGASDDILTSSILGSQSKLLAALFNQERSRKQERSADILGTRVLARSDYAADGMHTVMRRFAAAEGDRKGSWIDSHPISRERVRYLEELITRNQYNRYAYEGVSDYQSMKRSLGLSSNAGQPSGSNSANTSENTGQSNLTGSSNAKPATSPSSPPAARSNTPLASGSIIPLSQIQSREGVTVQLTEAEIMSPNSYKIKFKLDNQTSSNFGFVLPFSEVLDSSGSKVKARFSCQAGSDSFVDPGESVNCEAWVLESSWSNGSEQDLILLIKESTSGARVFRMGF